MRIVGVMEAAAEPKTAFRRDATLLSLISLTALLALHFFMGNGYGFHRDELQFLDDALHLQWGFVAYPPMTSFAGRLAVALFGISPQALRLPAAVANAASLVLLGLTARELGGRRVAQLLAVAMGFPVALVFSSVLQYNTFDLLAWEIVIFFTARVLRSEDPRNWLGAGVGLGLGVLSKYSIAFALAGLLAGLVSLPSQRHHLRSRWFWLGALVATAIALPNLLWLATHHFITIQMEQYIHARDVRLGRAAHYFADQLTFTRLRFPMAVLGLVALIRSPRFRLLSAFFLGPLLLLALLRGRGYYLLPAYAVLFAAAAVSLEQWLTGRARLLRFSALAAVLLATLLDSAAVGWAYLPIWPVGSAGWNWQMAHNDDMANEVGWPEFVAQVAAVRDTLSPAERSRLVVLANNFGEAGALSLYGPQYQLPTPISSTNSFHQRGYGSFEPQTVIVVGGELGDQLRNFESCVIAAQVYLPYGVQNEETRDHPEILICHQLRRPWPLVWSRSQEFG